MSDVHDHSEFSGDELLAAEYALGVLAGPDRATAERRMARDRGFAALVAAWEQRLAPWAAEMTEVAPPPDLWDRIVAELPAARAARREDFGRASRSGADSPLPARSRPLAWRAGSIFGAVTQQPPLIATVESSGRALIRCNDRPEAAHDCGRPCRLYP